MASIVHHLTQGNVIFAEREPFKLECGGELSPVTIRYAIFGEPNAVGDNVVLVCHALSGSARVDQWWPELFAPGGALANERWCVVCTNILGSCYGSTGPGLVDPSTGRPHGADFPVVTISDTVRAQAHVLTALGIDHIRAVIGASIGGMQALEWAIRYPERVDDCVAIAAAPLSPLGLALNHVQRLAIESAVDERSGLRLARALAMCTYKSAELFSERYGRKPNRAGDEPWSSPSGRFDVAGYLDHQGRIFQDRFDGASYAAITRAMDLWDPEHEHGPAAYERVAARVSLVGISSDWLFPAEDVRTLATKLRNSGCDCTYTEIQSAHGHDAFLAEPQHVNTLLNAILHEPAARPGTAFAAFASQEEQNGTTR
ncbi:MAG TPA: homoserine O-acetyltransferase [Clostridia bacterium]|nr:homoserine O-acetyltransferase [Clostridia bacterium]